MDTQVVNKNIVQIFINILLHKTDSISEIKVQKLLRGG